MMAFLDDGGGIGWMGWQKGPNGGGLCKCNLAAASENGKGQSNKKAKSAINGQSKRRNEVIKRTNGEKEGAGDDQRGGGVAIPFNHPPPPLTLRKAIKQTERNGQLNGCRE
ncbi:hypothetical protein niasHT_009429 [Heterodera trifolii]|uniref:Uncharacterized protein n=1 Tax=Heterodera trifolii TaxID=157864 RepID=A0ABD2MEG1_9BILA